MYRKIQVLTFAALLALPVTAEAQGVVRGSENGAAAGAAAAGPVGAAVGGVVGGITGGIAGLLGADEYPRFHQYIVERDVPSYTYERPVRVGVVLPPTGIEYYPVPPQFHVGPAYRYTVIDHEPVIVDRDYRVVQVID